MSDLIEQIRNCIEKGKVNKSSPYPGDMIDMNGADELTVIALEEQKSPEEILDACNNAMESIGERFSRNEVFVPELLMAAKAMQAVMDHLEPFFKSGKVKSKGKFIIGTVAGDLHDIGKNLVSMVVEGNGWEVIDLGVDVKTEKFLSTLNEHPEAILGLSALLTTTMGNMQSTISEVKSKSPNSVVIVGGAPLSQESADKMGADGYASDPQEAVNFLNNNIIAN